MLPHQAVGVTFRKLKFAKSMQTKRSVITFLPTFAAFILMPMTNRHHIQCFLALLLLSGTSPVMSQEKDEAKEIKLNENAIRMIQFDFSGKGENPLNSLKESPADKKWMKFKESVPFRRSFSDTTTVKKVTGFVRYEPYTIWTKYGEKPIEAVMPTIEYKLPMTWTLNGAGTLSEEYGRTLKPSTGRMYESATGSAGIGASISVDFDKILYESLTARGRAIKHNRKHANAWKTYAEYVPTIADSLKMPRLWKKSSDLRLMALATPAATDSVKQAENTPLPTDAKSKRQKKRHQRMADAKEIERVTSIEAYIHQRAAEDSIRRSEFLRKDKSRQNAYDIEFQNRRLNSRRN